nr:hypothetical protein CFP56_10860 [Quercus suber]
MRDYQPAPAVMKTRRHDNMVMWKANVGNINLNGTEYYSCYSVIGTHHLATFKGSSKMMNKAVREGRLSGFSVGTSTGDHLQLLDLSSVDLISKGNACISSRRNAADNFLNKVFKICCISNMDGFVSDMAFQDLIAIHIGLPNMELFDAFELL